MGKSQHPGNFIQESFSFLANDLELVVERLFSDQQLLKLLFHTTNDSLSKPDIIDAKDLQTISEECIKISPNIQIPPSKRSMIMVTVDSIIPSDNPKFVSYNLIFDVLCPVELWMMDDYMLRPFKIMHEIDQLFNNQKLTGIGTVQFMGAGLMPLGDYSGYQMIYSVINSA